LAETYVQLGNHEAAAEAASEMAGVFQDRAQENYYAACFISRCVPLAGNDPKAAHRYVEKAVSFLRTAAANAPSDLKRMKEEPQVFKPLASHPDFDEALGELNKKVPPPAGKAGL
jgi:hypothetical protein